MSDTQHALGKLVVGNPERDAIHIAVVAVTAAGSLKAGMRVGFLEDGRVGRLPMEVIGIVDPFLTESVDEDDKFWLFLLPNTITSLKHNWTHPAFPTAGTAADTSKSASERWMRAWAVEHMSEDYYGDGEKRSPEVAYADAIEAGHSKRVGPYEDARDHIDGEWWTHWEAITGQRGDRDTYFSCAC